MSLRQEDIHGFLEIYFSVEPLSKPRHSHHLNGLAGDIFGNI